METLKGYEKHVLGILLKAVFSEKEVTQIGEESELVSYEYTGSGCFLTIRHDALPVERNASHEPIVIGETNGVICGFVVFLQDKELTLEWHSWGEKEVPEDFRDQDVKVTAVKIESGRFVPLQTSN